MRVTWNHESGNGKNVRQLAPDHFSVETVGQGSSYAAYFNLKVENDTDKERLCRLDVKLDRSLEYSDLDVSGFAKCHFPLWMSSDGCRWSKYDNYHQMDLTYQIPLNLQAGETIYISPMIPILFSKLTDDMSHLYDIEGISTFHCIGQTSQGRPMPMVSIGHNDQRRILIISGLHGTEFPGIWASKGIIEYLLSSDETAQSIRKHFTVDVLPYGNPDGTFMGRQRTNAQDIDLHRQASLEFKPVASEIEAIWGWIEKYPPSLYINLHGWCACEVGKEPYEGALRPAITIYEKWKKQEMILEMDQSLIKNADPISRYDRIVEFGVTYSAEEANLLNLLAEKYGTYAYCYEPNMRTGLKGCMEKGIKVLKSLACPMLARRDQ